MDGRTERAQASPVHISRGEGLLAGGDFRARLGRIARKIAANPRPVGALLEGVDGADHLSSEIAEMRRKSIKILMEGKTVKEAPVEVIPNPLDMRSHPDSPHVYGRDQRIKQLFDTSSSLEFGNKLNQNGNPLKGRIEERPLENFYDAANNNLDDEKEGILNNKPQGIDVDVREMIEQGKINNISIRMIVSAGEEQEIMTILWRRCNGDRGPGYISDKGGGDCSFYLYHCQNKQHTKKMDKRMEIASGKKKQGEGEQSSAGENITPMAHGAIARTSGGRPGAHQLAAASAVASEKKFMASAFAAGNGRKKLAMNIPEGKAPEDDDVLVVDFEEAKKELKYPWMVVGRYNTKRMFNTAGLFARMRQVWQLQGSMVEKSIGEKRFLIVLGSEGDLKHILKGGPGCTKMMLSWWLNMMESPQLRRYLSI
ncbi:hypothetical protein ACQ4PT_071044 [Festuca glaucescens]